VPPWPHPRDARTAPHHCRSNLPEIGLKSDLENYEEAEASAAFEPDDEEGLRFLRALGDHCRDESPVRRRIEEYTTEAATADNLAGSGGRELQ
jgi:hypothetical protein